MFAHYLKLVIRNLWKNKVFSFINIFGLAIGMACSLLIFLFVRDENNYDRFNRDAENIHRIVKDFINDDGSRIPDATTPAALAPAMRKEIPEIVEATRVHPNWGGNWLVTYGDKKMKEEKIYRVDSNFFDVFSFSFIRGNVKTALPDAHAIVLTETAARRYFGNQDPMGKVMKVEGSGDMVVTGVIRDVPQNAHFHFDFLTSFRQLPLSLDANWGGYNYYTYIRVKKGTDMRTLEKKIQGVYERNQSTRYSAFYTQPLTGIHLTSHLKWELEPNGDRLYVYVFTLIGIFILLIGAINYINLSTAKSAVRSKEIGIRKVSGAVRSSLVKQFLLESVVTSLAGSLLAILIAQLLVPVVNSITQKDLTVIGQPILLAYMAGAAVVVGMVAGIFPAWYLSSFKPILVLKGFKLNEKGALNLRKSLVVVQFTISIALIIGALIIVQQIRFVQTARLGLDKDQVLVVKNAEYLSATDRDAFLNTIRQFPGIKKAATSRIILGGGFATSRMRVKGSQKEQQVNFSSVGYDYLDVVGIQLKEGRGFSKRFPSDSMNNGIPGGPLEQTIGSIVVNERAVKELGLGSPAVGKQLVWGNDGDTTYYVQVIGVMKDFNFTSLRNEIKPFAFVLTPSFQSNFTIKLSGDNIKGSLVMLENEWKKFTSARPFEYTFLDESFANLYTADERFQKLFISLVILGILIACLGLLGLATYAAQQRVKEIGIRKTLGASVASVVSLLSRDFLRLVLIALVIAIPVAWYAMEKWLQDFAYRITIQWWVFLLAGTAAMVIAFITISFQTFRAARANPVESLRTE